jgi:hypothetical protein
MRRREFTRLYPDEIADEIIKLITATIKRDRRFPALQAMERDLLFAEVRNEIETGLDEFASGIIEETATND